MNTASPSTSPSQYGPYDVIDFAGLCRRLGRGNETVGMWLRSGHLPAPVRISLKTRYWVWGHVVRHLLKLGEAQAQRPVAQSSSSPSDASHRQC